jgi:hypothetical protein
MEPPRLLVLIVASLLVVGGVGAVVAREWNTRRERAVVGPYRDLVEILIPAAGVLLLLGLVWRLV